MPIETLVVHSGYSPQPTTKVVTVAIHQIEAYAFDSTQHGADLFDLEGAGSIYTHHESGRGRVGGEMVRLSIGIERGGPRVRSRPSPGCGLRKA